MATKALSLTLLFGQFSTQSTRPGGKAVAAILLFFLFSGITPLRGQNSNPEDLNTLSLEQLGNVEVTTTSKEPEQVWQTPAAIYVITQEDLRRYGATTIPEALRLAPGVEVARIDSDHWAVGVRGFGGEFSKSLLVLIDGRSVYSPLFAGVYWQVQNTLMEDIDRIEVIRGPGGTIWGANAVQGIINIITKKAKDTHGSLFSLGGGNVDQGNGSSRFGGTLGKDIDYRVYARGFLRGPEFHPDGKNFDEWRMGQIGFRGDWQPNRRDSVTLQGDFYLGRDGERVEVSSYTPPSMRVIDSPHNTSGQNVTGNWRRQFSESSDIELRGYFDRTTRFSPQLDEVRNTFDLDLMYHVRVKGRQNVLLGVGGRWSPDAITEKYATLDFAPRNETDSIYSWFLQDEIKLLPAKLSLILGSKFEHNNRSGFEVQPNARLLWKPSEHQTFWLASTRAVRTPSRLDQDLQLTDFVSASPAVFLRVVGTKNFRSEQLVGSEAGYRTLLARKLYVDVALFRNYYNYLYGYGQGTAFVEVSPAPVRIVLQEPLANALKGDTAGGEIAPDWRPTSWLTLKGSYSYLHLYVHDRRGFTDTQNTTSDNGSSPHHEAVVQPIFTLPGRTEFDMTYRYVSALPAQKIGAYHTLDTRFGWHATHSIQLSVVGNNLLQPHHAEFGTDVNTIVGIKRSVYGSVVWTR